MSYTRKVHGPPGTGKTMTLLSIMADWDDAPDTTGFISFTRAAVEEARRRLRVTAQDEAPYMRTMHSLCYRALGKPALLKAKHLKEFGGTRYRFAEEQATSPEAEPDEMYPMIDPNNTGEVYRRFNHWARNKQVDYREAFRLFPEPGPRFLFEWNEASALRFCAEYDDYRRQAGVMDYVDLLEKALEGGYSPPVRTLYVDEAQDLSPLQWALVRRWSKAAQRTVLAGDADQAIYEFQGAEPGLFLDFPVDEEQALTVSHRLPVAILERSQKVIRRNRQRKQITVQPSGAEGLVQFFDEMLHLDPARVSLPQRTFILARNIYLLQPVTEWLMAQGIPYHAYRGLWSWSEAQKDGMLAFWHLHRGNPITGHDLQALADVTTTKVHWRWGSKTQIEKLQPNALVRPEELRSYGATEELLQIIAQNQVTALKMDRRDSEISHRRALYLQRILEHRGESGLTEPPHVITGTIHSVKGQEADTVFVLSSMSRRTYDGYWNDPEPERRVFYVGMTRAKRALHLQMAQNSRSFNEW